MSYFKPEEVVGLDPHLVEKLEEARFYAGTPFIITEGLASGGSHVPNTAHARGLAVDLRCANSVDRWSILNGLLTAGFTRIGIYDRHLHADLDTSLPQNVIWVGRSS